METSFASATTSLRKPKMFSLPVPVGENFCNFLNSIMTDCLMIALFERNHTPRLLLIPQSSLVFESITAVPVVYFITLSSIFLAQS